MFYTACSLGAIRQHLLCKLREQVSQQKAVERREAEEVRKMYNEEVEEDEGEMTGEGGMEAYVLLIANFECQLFITALLLCPN